MNSTGQPAITLYLSRKGRSIVDQAVRELRVLGLEITRLSTGPKYQLTIIGNGIRGIWDLNNTLLTIATQADGTFDDRLINHSYEALKIATILGARLKVITAYFRTSTQADRLLKLSELSTDINNLSIMIYREDKPDTGDPNGQT